MSFFKNLKSLFVQQKKKDNLLFDQENSNREKLGKDFIEEPHPLEENIEQVSEKVKDLSENLVEEGEKLKDKAQDFAEKVGHDVLDKADELYERGKDRFSEYSEKGKDLASDLKEKAKKTYDELYEKAKEEEAIEKSKPDYSDQSHADKLRETDILEGSDDFFSKAEKYAQGDYDGVREGSIKIEKSEESSPKENVNEGNIAGFEDRDGDGDDLIDDAEIDQDNKN